MYDKKKKDRNERVAELADTLGKLGYKIRKLEFLIDDNVSDESYSLEVGNDFLNLTLSI